MVHKARSRPDVGRTPASLRGPAHRGVDVASPRPARRLRRRQVLNKVLAEEQVQLELERLNNVFGAQLRITGLTAGAGPGIEFLDYLAPDDGRPTPRDVRANDLISWQTRFSTSDITTTTARLLPRTFGFVSPGTVTLDDTRLGFRTAALVRDPDGHAILIAER